MSLSDDEDETINLPNDDGDNQNEDFEPMQFMSYIPLQKAGEGTFSRVLKAQHTHTGRYVAIKCMKATYPNLEKVNRLREIQALKKLSPHPNIVKLLEVLYDQENGKLALVMELMEKNIYEWIRGRKNYISESKIKQWMWMMIKGIEHMHRNGIFHRDIKPENILLTGEQLKLADFGSCRAIHSKQPFTEYISTRWYRAPECLLTDGYYGFQMDLWGVGCVFYEIVTLMPLFPGKNEIDQIHKIHEVVGTPSPEMLSKFQKHASSAMDFNFHKTRGVGLDKKLERPVAKECLDLMKRLLVYNPEERITAKQALKHPYFKELREAERRARNKVVPARGNIMKGSVTPSSVLSPAHNYSSHHSSNGGGGGGGGFDASASIQITSGKYLPHVHNSTVKKNHASSDHDHHHHNHHVDKNSTNNDPRRLSVNGTSTTTDVSLPSLGGMSHSVPAASKHPKKYIHFAKRTIN
jgi:renal tumor antigen